MLFIGLRMKPPKNMACAWRGEFLLRANSP